MSGTVYGIVRRIGGIHMLNTLLLISLVLLTALFILQMRRSLKRSTLVNSLINEYIDHLEDPAHRDAFPEAPRLGELQEGTALRPHLRLLLCRISRLPAAQQGRRTEEARDEDDEFLPYLMQKRRSTKPSGVFL